MSNPNIADDIRKAEVEPLLPIEKKLIGWSLGIGVVAMAVLIFVSYTYFPAGG